MDEAGFLNGYDTPLMESYLSGVFSESGADVRFIFARDVPGDLEVYARNRARQHGMGRSSDRRGLLFVYDVAAQRMRIEVGPGLEGIFPDGFLGFLMREQTAAFFAAGDRWLGIKSTLFIVNHRLREASLSEEYDPRAATFITDSVRLASGGGGTTPAAMGSDGRALYTAVLTPEIRARFGPQMTIADVNGRYLEALREGYVQPDLPLFALGTDAVLRKFPMAAPYAAFILFAEYGHEYEIVQRGDLAILYFTTTPFVSPHLFRRGPAGWQMDIAAEVRNTRERVGSVYTWEMVASGDDYSRTFADLFANYNGVLRPARGDNRRLSTRKDTVR